jgi:hypothetical protein
MSAKWWAAHRRENPPGTPKTIEEMPLTSYGVPIEANISQEQWDARKRRGLSRLGDQFAVAEGRHIDGIAHIDYMREFDFQDRIYNEYWQEVEEVTRRAEEEHLRKKAELREVKRLHYLYVNGQLRHEIIPRLIRRFHEHNLYILEMHRDML